ncbi:MAG: LptF/LptG family permease [Chlamydiales bacterium]|nr:LptF/LptG family permease [Chlamydiales bacterium]
MNFLPIYERMLLKNLINSLLLIFGGIFAIFVLLDYALHMREMTQGTAMPLNMLFIYYACHISKYMVHLLPISLLIACIKVLTSLSTTRELIALQAGGLSLKKLARPFLATGLFCTLLLGINAQAWMPKALSHIDAYTGLRQHKIKKRIPHLYTIPLEDGSKLYYSHQSLETMALCDVIWVQSIDEIWRMQSLKLLPNCLEGYHVDHLKRDTSNNLVLTDTHEFLPMPQIHIETLAKTNFFTPFSARSITELNQLLKSPSVYYQQNHSAIESQIFYKMLCPMLALIAVLAVLKPAMRYRRFTNNFLIYTLSLLGFITVCAVLNAAVIIGEARVVPPVFAVGLPIAALFTYFGGRFFWL